MHRTLATLAALLLFPLVAAAQPADVPLTQISGTYSVKAAMPSDTDVISLCVVRVDVTPVIEYGCTPGGPMEVVTMEITVVATPNDDAEIRAYAVDSEGLVSDYSPNAGRIDFTKPGPPVLIL